MAHRDPAAHADNRGREWTWREGTPRPRYRYREQIMAEYERLFSSRAGNGEDDL